MNNASNDIERHYMNLTACACVLRDKSAILTEVYFGDSNVHVGTEPCELKHCIPVPSFSKSDTLSESSCIPRIPGNLMHVMGWAKEI